MGTRRIVKERPTFPLTGDRAYMDTNMDTYCAEKRSEVMSKIRSKGNRTTERRMAAMLRARGISGWRMQPHGIKGQPDFYFPALDLALFIDGCFWHACPKCFRMPVQNRQYWAIKIDANRRRDRRTRRSLNRNGTKVVRLWEHDLKASTSRLRSVLRRLERLALNRSSAKWKS
jgi:DNA mismatch endonuclease, patch repair protein